MNTITSTMNMVKLWTVCEEDGGEQNRRSIATDAALKLGYPGLKTEQLRFTLLLPFCLVGIPSQSYQRVSAKAYAMLCFLLPLMQ